MCCEGPSPPPVPDPNVTAQAQGKANTATAASQAALNLIDQITPYGKTTYNATGEYTNPEGQTVPRYTQNVELSPLGQSILSAQQDITNTLLPSARGLADQVASTSAKPLNFNTAFSDYFSRGPEQINKQAADAIYGQQKSFLDPQWGQQEQQLQDQLSRQGIPVGSEAYNNATKQLMNSRTQAYQSAQDAATAGGSAAASNLFGLAQAGQNQNISQQQMAQQQPISLLGQITGNAPVTPTQPIATPSQTPVAPTDVIGATASATNAAMQAYQAQLAQQNSMWGGLAGLAGSGVTAGALLY